MNIFEWIDSVGGVVEAAKILDESPRTLNSWKYGEKTPSPAAAKNVVEKTKRVVDFNSIYGPVFAVQANKAAKALIKKGSIGE